MVISGCETSLGEHIEGEGLNGLSRGFLASGAGAVIGSLWKVPDKPTANLMKFFYEGLISTNGNVSKALAIAQTKMAQSGPYRHPYFWAGFELTSFDARLDKNVFQ